MEKILEQKLALLNRSLRDKVSLEATMTLKNDFVSAAVPGEGTFCLFVLFKKNIKSSIGMTVMFLVK